MAILTQNDLDIYVEVYGVAPWVVEGLTYVAYAKTLTGKPLPKAFSLAAKKLSKQLSPQPLQDGPEVQAQYAIYSPMEAMKKHKANLNGTLPLLSSYAVRTA